MSKWVIVLVAVGAFVAGNATGFLAGVSSVSAGRSFIEDMVTTEQPADIEKQLRIERPGFELSYPGNWRIDDKDEDYDPDRLFSIESPGSASVTISVMPVVADLDDVMETQREVHRKLMPAPAATTTLVHWGAFDGKGMRMEGRIFGMKGTITAFAATSDGRTLMIVSQVFDDDRASVVPGLELIERTLKLR
ncbi:MAG: hypothetical protein A2138_14050 [Deltaproteobacteria bacterium RBG_16_71_12]|nr:MAG: hypothetical protein A2138_14050 [Deltaproteobacteria bacterium RBG_16_71_12]